MDSEGKPEQKERSAKLFDIFPRGKPNKDERSRNLRDLFSRARARIALGLTVAFIAVGWSIQAWIVLQKQPNDIAIRYAGALFGIGLLTNLTAASLIYCILYWTLSERILKEINGLESEESRATLVDTVEKSVKSTYESSKHDLSETLVSAVHATLDHWKETRVEEFSMFSEPPWDDWIRTAETIEICVQGMEHWVQKHESAWHEFFRHDGTVKLFLPNPDDPQVLQILLERLPDRDQEEMKVEIKNTYRHLKEAQGLATDGKIVHYQLRKMNWYCAVRFDERILLISPYEHLRVNQQLGNTAPQPSQEPHVKSPSYKIPLQEAAHLHTAKWIKKEFEGLASVDYSELIEHPKAGWDFKPTGTAQ